MKIAVLVKEVPDSYGERRLSLTTGLADRSASDPVLDEITSRAVEAAVSYAESSEDVEVALVTMGPESAEAMLRKTLAMGADSAHHVIDPELAGSDMTLSAEVLAAVLQRIECDLIIAGDVSSDGSGGVIPTMIAERMGIAHATSLDTLEITESTVTGQRATYGGTVTVQAQLPAVVSLTERHPGPRFPGFKGIMAAKKKPLETYALADLGIDPAADVPRSIMLAVSESPPRSAGEKIVDEGDAGTKLADYLIEKKLV
ncbi:electron transfer flavoprotein subunit beta/FixA family protein [Nesterenkonia haasae]|uniref:electron transfer flavoprotein subunit beta/FixA family protein n=1 Tax=Nesterenkonia haasae TaxID=2587813 RepID=UPI0012910382|nr:electron transfer flavoprotein subunit beta/FixA family protein [Nesterenkonia haasae]NDK30828.1 electron transfer flavoprotein subunit beta/FixA family protein [Nesterenkonia haasae]